MTAPAVNVPLVLISVVTLIVPLVIVPTVFNIDKEVNVPLLVAVMFPAVVALVASVAVAALPVVF